MWKTNLTSYWQKCTQQQKKNKQKTLQDMKKKSTYCHKIAGEVDKGVKNVQEKTSLAQRTGDSSQNENQVCKDNRKQARKKKELPWNMNNK